MSIDIKKDNKSPTWIITKTDGEGFHHQLHLTGKEIMELMRELIYLPIRDL